MHCCCHPADCFACVWVRLVLEHPPAPHPTFTNMQQRAHHPEGRHRFVYAVLDLGLFVAQCSGILLRLRLSLARLARRGTVPFDVQPLVVRLEMVRDWGDLAVSASVITCVAPLGLWLPVACCLLPVACCLLPVAC